MPKTQRPKQPTKTNNRTQATRKKKSKASDKNSSSDGASGAEHKSSAAAVRVKQKKRDVVYPEPDVKLCAGKQAITHAQAKQLLGWQEETENVKFGNSYLLQDSYDRKIRCTNNITNRPLYANVVNSLRQEVLRRRWQLNGEPIIIGRTGLVLNGQHTLIALVLASQEWEKHPGKWKDYWQQEPMIDKLLVLGINEADEVVNTMDTCKPRTLMDVIYRSTYFADLKDRDRRVVSGMCDYAVRLMWHRTAASKDAFAPRRTHSESLDFIERHPRLLDAVKHIHEENTDERKINRYVTPGAAAGLLYLQACCETNPKAYRSADHPNEEHLDLGKWDTACNFWVELASGSERFKPVRHALAQLLDDYGGRVPFRDRVALLVKAWDCYASDVSITAQRLELEYDVSEDGIRVLLETPTVGGIDVGDPEALEDQMGDITSGSSPEKAKGKQPKKSSGGKPPTTPRAKRAGDSWAPGDTCWVEDQDGEPYFATVTELPLVRDDGSTVVMVADNAGGNWEVALEQLHTSNPG